MVTGITRRGLLGGVLALGLERMVHGAAPSTSAVKLRVGPAPGELAIVNEGKMPVRLRRKVVVEHFNERATDYIRAGWQALPTEMNLVATCDRPYGVAPSLRDCVVVAPGETLAVPRWLGGSCTGQCNRACRSDAYFGGRTRFRVATCDGRDIISQDFMMPPISPGLALRGTP